MSEPQSNCFSPDTYLKLEELSNKEQKTFQTQGG